jgi:hypothetical protein
MKAIIEPTSSDETKEKIERERSGEGWSIFSYNACKWLMSCLEVSYLYERERSRLQFF